MTKSLGWTFCILWTIVVFATVVSALVNYIEIKACQDYWHEPCTIRPVPNSVNRAFDIDKDSPPSSASVD